MTTLTQVRKDLIGALIGLGIAGFYYLGATRIPKSGLLMGKGVGADALPRMLAAALAMLGLLLLARAAWQLATGKFVVEDVSADKRREDFRRHYRAAGMLAIGIAYVAIFEWIGWALAVFLLIVATALYNGNRRSWRTAAFAATVTAVLYLLFDLFLKIPLPAGIWPEVWAHVTG